MRVSVVIFALMGCSGLLCDVITTDGAMRTVSDFVDVLKQDLRRNNDDYIESTTATTIIVPNPFLSTLHAPNNDTKSNQTLTKQGTFHYRRGPFNTNTLFVDKKNISAAQRRVFQSPESKSAEINAFATNRSEIKTTFRPYFVTPNKTIKLRTLPRRTTFKVLTNVLKFNRSAANAKANFRSSNNRGEKETQKINKIKSFIERNKELFEEFMEKKRMETEKVNNIELQVPLKTDSESESGAGLRQRAYSQEMTSLQPDQLDMAAAKGGQVHAHRIKGRLCHRHVLIPEGPKYNSRGEVYLGAYGHARGRNYSLTRRPKFVLPRCCNCCKKSLLGCE